MAVLRLVIIRVCHVIFYKKILLLLLLGYEILRLIHRRIPHSVVTIHQVLVVLIGLSYMVRLRLLIHVVASDYHAMLRLTIHPTTCYYPTLAAISYSRLLGILIHLLASVQAHGRS